MRLTQPKVDTILLTKRGFPLFGCSLASHLASFSLPSGIAFPLQLCVTRLVILGLEEEGLFRLAAGASKVKRLRAELEAGLTISLPSLETADHHVLTATIKSYLRELPEPLMGAELYKDWLEAGQLVRIVSYYYYHTTHHQICRKGMTGLMPSGTFYNMKTYQEKTTEISSTCSG